MLAVLGIWVAATVGGAAYGKIDGWSQPSAKTSGGTEFSIPKDFRLASQSPLEILNGLGMKEASTLVPKAGKSEGMAIVGVSDGHGTRLLSTSARRNLRDMTPVAFVEIGQRYGGVREAGRLDSSEGDYEVVIYAIPTATVTVDVVCAQGRGPEARRSRSACEWLATTIDISHRYGQAVELASIRPFRQMLGTAISEYGTTMAVLRKLLGEAKTNAEEVLFAEKLTRLCSDTDRRVERLARIPSAGNAKAVLVASINRLGHAYRMLARAARGADKYGYAHARREVYAAEGTSGFALREAAAL